MTKQKNDLIAAAAGTADVTIDQAKAVVNAFLQELMKEVSESGHLEVRGFGTLTARVRPGRLITLTSRTKTPGAQVQSRELVHIHFKATSTFKDLVLEEHQKCQKKSKSASNTSANSETSKAAPTTPSKPTSESLTA